jgi:chromosome segregation ATPase
MASDTRIYVNKETFERQTGELNSKLNELKTLLGEYEQKKEEAKQVWGDEDENQKKALDLCESAINVVKRKISETVNTKTQLENVSSDAYASQEEMGRYLEDAKREIDALMK